MNKRTDSCCLSSRLGVRSLFSASCIEGSSLDTRWILGACSAAILSRYIILCEASFTRKRFNQKEHRFMLVFSVRLHGDSENDHKKGNGLQSEAFQKRTSRKRSSSKRKKLENVARNCKRSCDNRIFLPFLWCLHEWRPTQKGH